MIKMAAHPINRNSSWALLFQIISMHLICWNLISFNKFDNLIAQIACQWMERKLNLLCIYGQDKANRFPLDFFKGLSDCIFPFLAVYVLFECRCDGGEESQDFPENPNVLHCSDYKVYPLLGNSNTGILLVDFFFKHYISHIMVINFFTVFDFFFYRSCTFSLWLYLPTFY